MTCPPADTVQGERGSARSIYGASGFEELRRGIVRTIVIRRITLGVFSVVALVVLFASGMSYLNPLLYSPLVWFVLTFPFKLLIDRQRTIRTLHWAHTAFFVAEVVLITFLVHYMGGSEWIGVTFYLFTVIYANIFLTRFQGALVTLLVVCAYSALVLGEYAGFIPHRELFAATTAPHRNLGYALATILAGAVGTSAVVAFTVRAFTDVFAHKNRMLAARERQLAELSQRLLTAQDEERRRIARGLHDGLIQSLAAIKMRLSPERQRMGEEAYRQVCGIVDTSIAETRTLAYSIRPPLLDNLGLVPSLRRLAETTAVESGLAISVDAEEIERRPVSLESLLFFAAQQAMQNVVRHARARSARIALTAVPSALRLTVTDDGVGLSPEEVEGLGLRGVRERVEVSGGRFNVCAAPGSGTIIVVEVPDDAPTSRSG